MRRRSFLACNALARRSRASSPYSSAYALARAIVRQVTTNPDVIALVVVALVAPGVAMPSGDVRQGRLAGSRRRNSHNWTATSTIVAIGMSALVSSVSYPLRIVQDDDQRPSFRG
jgi:hypothetical protein